MPGSETISETLDVRGESCPMPLLMAKRALQSLPSGSVLRVLSTDSGSERDFESFGRIAGHLISCEELSENVLQLTIIKA